MSKKQIALFVDGVDDRRIVDQDGKPVTIEEARRLWAGARGEGRVASEYGTGGRGENPPIDHAVPLPSLVTRHSSLATHDDELTAEELADPAVRSKIEAMKILVMRLVEDAGYRGMTFGELKRRLGIPVEDMDTMDSERSEP